MSDILTRLKLARQEYPYQSYQPHGLLSAAIDEVERLRGRVAELEEALRPFAEEAEYVPDYATDMHLNYEMDDAEILEYANFDAADIHKAFKVLGQRASCLQAGGSNDPT